MKHETLILTEYRHFSESFWKNEEGGERRVSFFLTLVTAVLGGLVAFWTKDLSASSLDASGRRWLTVAALSFLLVFGIATYLRMLQRDYVTDGFKEILDYLRAHLVALGGHPEYQIPFRLGRHALLKGGLAQSVGVINSILVGATVFIAGGGTRWTGAAIGLAIVLHHLPLLRRQTLRPEHDIVPRRWFRAGVGAVIISDEGRVACFERADVPGSWQLPQGGLDEGEGPPEALLRELKEEVGLHPSDVEIVKHLTPLFGYRLPEDYQNLKTGGGQVQDWFLVSLTGGSKSWEPKLGEEFRGFRWTSMEDLIAEAAPFRVGLYEQIRDQLVRTGRAT